MTKNFCYSILGLLIALTFPVEASADTFEFLTYTPPRGWTNQASQDRRVYQRASGIGLITFFASYPASSSASDEFARMWRARVEPTLSGEAPQPQMERDRDYTVAVGSRQVDAQGTLTTIALAAMVGRGRAISVLTISAGDDVFREVTAFFDSIKITPGPTPATTTSNSDSVSSGEIEVKFAVPPGYVSRRDGRLVLLIPTRFDDKTPCAYGLSPARPSSGNLEADARAALLEPHPGWKLKDDSYTAMRGIAGDGWKYYWLRAGIESFVGGNYQYVNAMAMAFPAGQGQVNILWGVGNAAHCLLDDLTFARLFHTLHPRGWNSDSGKALARELQGTWRYTHSYGVTQYKFMEQGRYEYGRGTTTTTGMLESTSSSASDGRYTLRGAELTLTPDARDRGVSKYRVRIYDHYNKGGWVRAMSLLNENGNPALDVEYMRIEDSR